MSAPPAGLRVLSLGTNRGLWQGAGADDDTPERLASYAARIETYRVIVHSLRGHGVRGRVGVGATGSAVATNAFNRLDSWVRMVAHGLRMGARERFTVVYAQEPLFTGTAAWLLSRLLRVPLGVCVYGSNPFDPHWTAESRANRLLAPVARWVLRRAHLVQVDGSMTARHLAESGVPRARIAFKPIIPANAAQFAGARRDAAVRARLDDGGRFGALALFVGRMVAQKNLPMLLDVVQRTAASAPGLRFVMVGEGPLRGELMAECARRGVEDRVLWTGGIPHAELPAVFAACDLFVLPSAYEGFPRVMMEAAAAGLPIVTTEVSGSDDAVVEGENGFVVPIGDAAAFAARVETVAGDPERARRMGAHGRERMRALAERYGDPRVQVEIWRRVQAPAGVAP